MARFGRLPITIPDGVEVKVDGEMFVAKGPKGELKRKLPREVKLKVDGKEAFMEIKNQSKVSLAQQGTNRSHLMNMVKGVKEGWNKNLELVGTGFRAEVRGNDLVLTVGYSHTVTVPAPEGIKFTVEKNVVKVEGIDLEKVSLTAAKIREVRKPDAYQGKGIKYQGEKLKLKPGKQAAKAG